MTDYPQKIRGFRSRPINAIIDAGRASTPVAGANVGVLRGPGGSVISAGGTAPRPFPFMARLIRHYDASVGSQSFPAVQVFLGRIYIDELGGFAEYSGGDEESDALSGLDYVVLSVPSIGSSVVYLSVSDSPLGYTVGTDASSSAYLVFEVASIGADGSVAQYIMGDQYVFAGGVSPGPDASGAAVAKFLGGTDYNAATDSWRYGEIDQVTGKPTYPVFNPTRLYWWEAQHKLLCFRRTMTYNSSGLLVAVSEESLDPTPSVFTSVAEMP